MSKVRKFKGKPYKFLQSFNKQSQLKKFEEKLKDQGKSFRSVKLTGKLAQKKWKLYVGEE